MGTFNISVYRRSQFEARRRAQIKRNELCSIVMELVHIDNLGPLPPSPRVLEWKAVQTGLVSEKELFNSIGQYLHF